MSFQWINMYVDGLRDHCYSDDVFEMYDILNIQIRRVGECNPMLQGNDSIYIRDYFGIEVVFIRDDLTYKCEKFILAHELGHAVLHTELSKAAYSRNLVNRGKLEKQADYFAIKLLRIRIDKVCCEGLTTEQIAGELFITKDSLKLCSIK